MKTLFKICSCCNKEFETKEQFIKLTTLVAHDSETGLSFYNCDCKSTLTIETYEGSKEEAKIRRQMKKASNSMNHSKDYNY